QQHRKVIVLFSDGGNDDGAGALQDVAAECAKRNIDIIVVALGGNNPVAIPVSQLSETDRNRMRGQEWYTVDGEIQKTAVDENTLRFFANTTRGRYVHVRQPSDFHIGSMVGGVAVKYIKGEQEL